MRDTEFIKTEAMPDGSTRVNILPINAQFFVFGEMEFEKTISDVVEGFLTMCEKHGKGIKKSY